MAEVVNDDSIPTIMTLDHRLRKISDRLWRIDDRLKNMDDTLTIVLEIMKENNRKSEEMLKENERDNMSSESMVASAEVLDVDSEPLRQNDQATIEKSKCM